MIRVLLVRFARFLLRLSVSAVCVAIAAVCAVTVWLPAAAQQVRPPSEVTVGGSCRPQGLGMTRCEGTWTDGTAPVHGTVTGRNLAAGQIVIARVQGEVADVPRPPLHVALGSVVSVGMLWAAKRVLRGKRRRSRRETSNNGSGGDSSGGDDWSSDSGGGDSGGGGGGDGGGGD